MLKVFFTGSAREYSKMRPIYLEITNILQKLNTELTWQLVKSVDEKLNKSIHELTVEDWQEVYRNMANAMNMSDVVVLENTTSAFSTGYIAGVAISKAIPTLVLHNVNTQHTFKTSFIYGINSPYLTVEAYRTVNDLYLSIKKFVELYSQEKDTSSFHLKLSRPEKRFVDQMAKKLNISKIQFIRKLIKDQMIKH